MKPLLLKVDVAPQQSFKIRSNVNPLYYSQWHYHEELELTLIRSGAGVRFVGDNIENFQAGDLILLGSNLPHFWRSDEAGPDDAERETCQATVVHFGANFWGEAFTGLPEMANIKDLFARARRGIKITGNTLHKISKLMEELEVALGIERIMLLLRILQIVSDSTETSFLSSAGFNVALNETDTKRIASIYSYTLSNFSRKIMLDEVASVAHLTTSAFCRYFKTHTGKTYTHFLQEIRVGHACRLLMEDKLSIGQISLESGFQNFSNFNRCFKATTGMPPQEYRRLHLGGR